MAALVASVRPHDFAVDGVPYGGTAQGTCQKTTHDAGESTDCSSYSRTDCGTYVNFQ